MLLWSGCGIPSPPWTLWRWCGASIANGVTLAFVNIMMTLFRGVWHTQDGETGSVQTASAERRNTMRSIDADVYQEELEELYRVRLDWRKDTTDERLGLTAAMCALADAPTIDAVPVVRCKSCNMANDCSDEREMYCSLHHAYKSIDYFCADGYRKEEHNALD
jgi:hypothetical protein